MLIILLSHTQWLAQVIAPIASKIEASYALQMEAIARDQPCIKYCHDSGIKPICCSFSCFPSLGSKWNISMSLLMFNRATYLLAQREQHQSLDLSHLFFILKMMFLLKLPQACCKIQQYWGRITSAAPQARIASRQHIPEN